MEEIGVSCVMLLQTVEADFVNQQDFGTQKELEFPFEGVVRERREEFTKHCCGGNIAAAEGFLTADEQKRLGNVALAGAGGSGKDQSLLSTSPPTSRDRSRSSSSVGGRASFAARVSSSSRALVIRSSFRVLR